MTLSEASIDVDRASSASPKKLFLLHLHITISRIATCHSSQAEPCAQYRAPQSQHAASPTASAASTTPSGERRSANQTTVVIRATASFPCTSMALNDPGTDPCWIGQTIMTTAKPQSTTIKMISCRNKRRGRDTGRRSCRVIARRRYVVLFPQSTQREGFGRGCEELPADSVYWGG